jgi:hypothetical protein
MLYDHSIFGGHVARAFGVRWYGCNRPNSAVGGAKRRGSRAAKRAHRRRRRPQGGVGFLVLDNSLIVNKIFEDKKGIIALSVQQRGGATMPFAVVNVYNPPATSPLNAGDSRWSADILATLAQLLQRLHREYELVLCGGDFNMRAGEYKYVCKGADGKRVWYTRKTSDNQFALSAARSHDFRKFMTAAGVCPVHGDRGQVAGYGTSRAIGSSKGGGVNLPPDGHGAESDAVLVRVGTPPERVRALANAFSWAEMPAALTHVPVAVTVTLQPRPPAAAGAAGGGIGSAVRQVERAVYRDAGWQAMADQLDLVCGAVRPNQAAGASIDTVYETFIAGVRSAAAATLSSDREPSAAGGGAIAAPPPAPPGPAARRCGARRRGAARGPLRLRKLPAEQATLAERCRQLRRRLYEGNLSQKQRTELRKMRTQASRALRRWARVQQADAIREAQRALCADRVINPSRMWQELKRISPVDPDCFASSQAIPDKLGELPARQRFFQHQCRLGKETRGTAPCRGVTEYAAFLPRERVAGAGAELLAKPITKWEVYVALFPMHRDVLTAHAEGCLHGCGPSCTLWREFAARVQSSALDDPDLPLPEWKPSVSTARSAGCDGLRVETLRFARPEAEAQRLQFRLRVCDALAAMFCTWLAANRVPTAADFRRQIVTPLAKGGADFDASDPDLYRGISVGNVVPKVFSLVLLSRMTHWMVNNGLVLPEQVGFMPMHNAEMHVLTLREMLLLRRRAKQDSYALFVDLKKAYDEVHLPTLWHILQQAGVPAGLVELLREWDSSRTAAIRVNGDLSEDFATDKGVPQGEVMSPLLFNLFIESLSRRLKALPGFEGVTVTSRSASKSAAACAAAPAFHLTHLLYADDLVILAATTEQLQRALTEVDTWCNAFGMQMGLARHKTEAMAFRADRSDDLTTLPRLTLPGGRTVAWTKEYKYLGLPMRCDLSVEPHVGKYAGKLRSLHGRFFAFNKAVQRLPAAFQQQVVTTMLAGSVSYLMGVLPLTDTAMRNLDGVMRKVTRGITHCPHSAPTTLVDAERQTLPFSALVLKHHMRLYFYLKHTPFTDAVAVRLLLFLESGDPGGSSNWLQWTLKELSAATTSPGPAINGTHRLAKAWQPVVHSLRDIPRQTTLLARSLSFSNWQGERMVGLGDLRSHLEYGGCRAVTSGVTPRAGPPLAHVSDLLGGCATIPWMQLGVAAFATPLSIIGPGCTSLLSICTLPVSYIQAPMRLRLGQQAFSLKPWCGVEVAGADVDDTDDVSESDSDAEPAATAAAAAARKASKAAATKERFRRAYKPVPCPHCAGAAAAAAAPAAASAALSLADADAVDGPWHFCFRCSHPRVRALQLQLREAAVPLISSIADLLEDVSMRVPAAYRHCSEAAAAAQLTRTRLAAGQAALDVYWQSTHGRFLLNRLLTVLPFPEAVVSDLSANSLAATLGRLFDLTTAPDHLLRRLANRWVAWSHDWIRKFAKLRRELSSAAAAARRRRA